MTAPVRTRRVSCLRGVADRAPDPDIAMVWGAWRPACTAGGRIGDECVLLPCTCGAHAVSCAHATSVAAARRATGRQPRQRGRVSVSHMGSFVLTTPYPARGCDVTFRGYAVPASSRWRRTLQGLRHGCTGLGFGAAGESGGGLDGRTGTGASGTPAPVGFPGGTTVLRCCRRAWRLARTPWRNPCSITAQASSQRSL